MEGAVELFSSFIPNVSIVDGSGSNVKITKRFSPGALLAMICYGVIGAGIGALV